MNQNIWTRRNLSCAAIDKSKRRGTTTVCCQAGEVIQQGLIERGQVGIQFHEFLAAAVLTVRGRPKR